MYIVHRLQFNVRVDQQESATEVMDKEQLPVQRQ